MVYLQFEQPLSSPTLRRGRDGCSWRSGRCRGPARTIEGPGRCPPPASTSAGRAARTGRCAPAGPGVRPQPPTLDEPLRLRRRPGA
ncbi:hypothetical protein ACPA9J_34715 [Pseudomonas aeruginosa]